MVLHFENLILVDYRIHKLITDTKVIEYSWVFDSVIWFKGYDLSSIYFHLYSLCFYSFATFNFAIVFTVAKQQPFSLFLKISDFSTNISV